MGLDAPRALGAIRLTVGYDTTEAEIDAAAAELAVASVSLSEVPV
jgi:cysteine sulfinate desulfinase/cysteine desulfurase-like protein